MLQPRIVPDRIHAHSETQGARLVTIVLLAALGLGPLGCGSFIGYNLGAGIDSMRYDEVPQPYTRSLDAARRAGFGLLTLDAKPGEAAEEPSRRVGWTAAGTIPRYVLDPDGTPHDAVSFYKELNHLDPARASGAGGLDLRGDRIVGEGESRGVENLPLSTDACPVDAEVFIEEVAVGSQSGRIVDVLPPGSLV